MSDSNGKQQLKLLYLIQIMFEETDDNHGLSCSEICERLKEKNIHLERKTFYKDIEKLGEFGIEVLSKKDRKTMYYYVANRKFELPELKLLVDAVQSSKFITDKKSKTLIDKISNLTSIYEAKMLERQVYVSGRIKTENENIYYNIDQIFQAIGSNMRITFHYQDWTISKRKKLRHDGALYDVSPWKLAWMDQNYYLIGFDEFKKKIKHYRVDKMIDTIVSEKKRNGREVFRKIKLESYTDNIFGMFGGEEVKVTIQASNKCVGIFLDRLGTDISIKLIDDSNIEIQSRVKVSEQFFGWLLSLGNDVRLIGPERIVNDMRKMLDDRVQLYKQ